MDFLKTYFTYDQLRCIWWLLIGVLMLGWAITDGFDAVSYTHLTLPTILLV